MCERKEKKPSEKVVKNPDNSPLNNFWNYFKNKSESGGGNKTHESIVTSPVLHLNKNPDPEESTRIQVYPAMAVVVNTFNKDGTLKNSVTHFQPDFNSFEADAKRKEATYVGNPISADNNFKNIQNPQHTVNNFLGDVANGFPGGGHERPKDRLRQGGAPWPFAGYSPLREPFLPAYNAFATSMYNAVSSMVEYAPETDIYPKEKDTAESVERVKTDRRPSQTAPLDRYRKQDEEEEVDPDFFDEVTMRSEGVNKKLLRVSNDRQSTRDRQKRDASSIFLKTRRGDRVDITLEEPSSGIAKRRKPGGTDLILRKGGIAIAGPGGAATAYTGGTAIVGPYGTVYKSPEGTAILGPFAKVVNITDDTSFEEILKMHRQMQTPQQPIPTDQQKKLTGFKNYRDLFSYITDLPIKIQIKPQARNYDLLSVVRSREDDIVKTIEEIRKGEFRRIVQNTPYEEKAVNTNDTTLIFRPKSKAEAGRNGVALSAPTSHAILYPGQKANIYFEPESIASAGPSGFAHAHSDLFVSYIYNATNPPEPDPVRDTVPPENDAIPNSHDERARSFSPILVNTPPLSTILRPPHQESRQFLGYADKKRKTKPSKPIKEEGSNEEVGEEQEEESSSQGQESGNEAVAISPPPEGASVAEAKPIGLAIAGPGGVAASKPQGTAVAGPGGLAIARPVGTAIAGVEVEGSVPIGGQQKNKKKPKQEQEQTETELHYVGGLTGPIGNPKPKEFADRIFHKSVKETQGNNIQDNMFFRGRHNANGFQFKLGQQDGKYGFIPMFAASGTDRLQKRMDSPTFFHGLLGNEGNDQFQNYQMHF